LVTPVTIAHTLTPLSHLKFTPLTPFAGHSLFGQQLKRDQNGKIVRGDATDADPRLLRTGDPGWEEEVAVAQRLCYQYNAEILRWGGLRQVACRT
jgi:hypothetical protein